MPDVNAHPETAAVYAKLQQDYDRVNELLNDMFKSELETYADQLESLAADARSVANIKN